LDGTLWEDAGPGRILDLSAQKTAQDKLVNLPLHFAKKPKVFIITNQTAAARGICFYPLFWFRVTFFLKYLRFIKITNGFSVCYHHPKAKSRFLRKDCSCRKPLPGGIYYIINKYNLENSDKWLIGDRITDILAGETAGINRKFLIFRELSLTMNEVPKDFGDLKEYSCTFLPVNSWDEILEYIDG
jgi:histidinol phosphatase-like enzyme